MLVSALVAQACEFACDGRVPSCEGNGYRLELVHVLKTQATALLQQVRRGAGMLGGLPSLCIHDVCITHREFSGAACAAQGGVCILTALLPACAPQSGREGQAAPLLNTAYELLEKLDGEVLPEALQPEVQALVCQVGDASVLGRQGRAT